MSWLVYTRSGKGWQTYDQLDPVETGMRKIGLGGLYTAMRRKFYFDELYKATIVRFASVVLAGYGLVRSHHHRRCRQWRGPLRPLGGRRQRTLR